MRQELERRLFDTEPRFFDRGDPRRSLMCFGFEHGDGWFPLVEELVRRAKWRLDHPSRVKNAEEISDGGPKPPSYRIPFPCFPETRAGAAAADAFLQGLPEPHGATPLVTREQTDQFCPFRSDPRDIRDRECRSGLSYPKGSPETGTPPLGMCPGCEGSGQFVYYRHRCERPWEHFRIVQVKQKFGGLRFYYEGGDPEFRGAADLAEAMSYRICEACGAWGSVRDGRWVQTLCDACAGTKERGQLAAYQVLEASQPAWHEVSDL